MIENEFKNILLYIMFVSSSKKPDLSYFSESQTECLDQSIAANKDKVYIPSNSSNCDCLDW